MIIASCPTRISFGSLDHSPYSENFGGVALSACIDKRVYILIRERNHLENYKYRISYSKTELCNSVEEIQHPIVREALLMLNIKDPLEIIYLSDVPAQSGLATSSAMTIALLRALYYYKNIGISADMLMYKAYELERVRLKEKGGWQDHISVFGGLNYSVGSPFKVKREPLLLSPERMESLQQHLLLLYVGNAVSSHDILQEQLTNLKKGKTLEESSRIKKLVEEMSILIRRADFNPMYLAPALKEAWEYKKKLSSSITSPDIQKIEDVIKELCPSAGYRLIGAGGRGLLMVLAEPKDIKCIKETATAPVLGFTFDFEGVKVTRIHR
jgi:D-glycero-alpha-D-manno-heptose-7-phosphate kinase